MAKKGEQKLKLKSFSREQIWAFAALSVGYITMFCPAVLVEPFFPAEARKHGVAQSLSGMILSISSLVMTFASPFIGFLITFAGPKTILLVGILVNAVSMTTFGLLEYFEPVSWFTAGAFVTLGFAAFGGACVYTATLTFAAKLFPENTSLVIGTTETFIAVADVISLLSGGLLHDMGGFHLPFMFFGVIHAMSLPVCYILLPRDCSKINGSADPEIVAESQVEKEEKKTNIKPWHVAKIPRTVLMALVIFVTGIFWSFLGANLEEHLSPLELSKTELSMMFLLSSVWYGIACPGSGWLADKLPQTWPMIAIGLLGSGVGCAFLGPLPIFGLGNTIWLNVIVLTTTTIFQAAATIPAYEAALLFTIEAGYDDDVDTYAVTSSLITMAYGMGSFVGTFIGGFMVEGFGFPYSAAIFGAVLLAWSFLVTFYFMCCYRPPRKPRASCGSLKLSLRRKSLGGSLLDFPRTREEDRDIEMKETSRLR